MRKLIILQGPPASGKSTWVKQYLDSLSEKERNDTIVINRDSIRESTGTYWVPNREKYITDIEDSMMIKAMEHGLTIISDNTNLNPKTILKFKNRAEDYEYDIEWNKFYIPYKEALLRDSKRERSTGKSVIKSFYMKYFEKEFRKEMYIDNREIKEDSTLQPCIICDLDGTVAIHTSGRSPYEYERCEEDRCNSPLMENLIRLRDSGVDIFFITGREDDSGVDELSRQHSCKWLTSYMRGREYHLLMREKGDHRSGEIVKKELYEKYIKDTYYVIGIYEDSNKCVKMWRKLGLPCYQVWESE